MRPGEIIFFTPMSRIGAIFWHLPTYQCQFRGYVILVRLINPRKDAYIQLQVYVSINERHLQQIFMYRGPLECLADEHYFSPKKIIMAQESKEESFPEF